MDYEIMYAITQRLFCYIHAEMIFRINTIPTLGLR